MALPRKILKPAAPLAFILALSACAPGGHYLRSGYRPPASLAVLPFNNHTTDLDGPGVTRFWVDQRLAEKKGYRTLPLDRIDKVLKDLGVTDGGQLTALTPQQIGAALGAEALVYGDLLEFGGATTGFLNIRRVRARLRMVDAATGERLWEGEGNGASSETAVSPSGAARAAVKALGTSWAKKAAGSPLRTQTLDMVWNAIEYLPQGR